MALELNSGRCGVKFFSADFSNAFNTVKLREDERRYAVFKGMPDDAGRNRYYVSKLVVFGLAAAIALGKVVLDSYTNFSSSSTSMGIRNRHIC